MKQKSKKSKAKAKPERLSMRALARALHRSPSHICRVLKGERKPSAELERKMRKLGLKPGELKEGK